MTKPDLRGEQGQVQQETKEGLKRRIRKCWWTTCESRAFFEDWTGARYCPYHTYYTIRWGGGKIWYGIKSLRIYLKGLL